MLGLASHALPMRAARTPGDKIPDDHADGQGVGKGWPCGPGCGQGRRSGMTMRPRCASGSAVKLPHGRLPCCNRHLHSPTGSEVLEAGEPSSIILRLLRHCVTSQTATPDNLVWPPDRPSSPDSTAGRWARIRSGARRWSNRGGRSGRARIGVHVAVCATSRPTGMLVPAGSPDTQSGVRARPPVG